MPHIEDQVTEKELPASMVAAEPASRVSGRYQFISTKNIIAQLKALGYRPSWVSQVRTRSRHRSGFQKHMIRFRHAKHQRKLQVNDTIPEIVLVNSHDATSALSLSAGILRLACSNGLLVSENSIPELRVVHRKFSEQWLQDGVNFLANALPEVEKRIGHWSKATMSQKKSLSFAERAIALRWPEAERRPSVQPASLLLVKRKEDANPSPWNIYNRVQENIINGGFMATFKGDAKQPEVVRPVRSLDRTIELNRGLWRLLEALAPG